MSEIQQQPESILITDCGSTTTKVALLDVVAGEYRFIAQADAPSTVNDPWADVSIGVAHAIRRLEEITGHTFLDKEGQLIRPQTSDGKGIDLFFAVTSAAEPLRVVLTGLSRDVSLASLRRAVLSTYSVIEDEITLQHDMTQERPRTDDDKVNAIWHASPDLICMVGGTDGGAHEGVLDILQNVVRVALYLMGDNIPTVVYAGNDQLREAVTGLIGKIAPVQIVDNVYPAPGIENLGPVVQEIELCCYDRKINDQSGTKVLGKWGAAAVLPAARMADYTIRYCDRAWNPSKAALSVDIGSASVTLNASLRGHPLTLVRSDLGIGYGMAKLLDQVEMRDVLRWLPYKLDESEAYDRLRNKALRPGSIPQTREDLLLEHAIAREAVRLAIRELLPGWLRQPRPSMDGDMIPPCDPIIGGGGILAHTPYHGHTALLLLDALQPLGISEIYLDEFDLVPMLGAVAEVQPIAMVQTLRGGGLTFLGTVVVPVGHARPGRKAVTIRPIGEDRGATIDVTYGSLAAIPFPSLPPGSIIELRPAPGFDIGPGPGKSVELAYKGGTVGLIVDARGRPLEFSDDPERQRNRVDDWLREMTNA